MIRRLILAAAIALAALAPTARAEEIVMGLSSSEVAITATFDGSDILIFGAVKREGAPPGESSLHVIVTVSGPRLPVTVRRMDRRLGIWMNVEAARVDAAPSYYAVATTAPLSEILTETEDLRHSISVPRAIRSVGNVVEDTAAYTEALIRIRVNDGLYDVYEGGVDFERETLFRTSVALPANLVEGNYITRIFLTRDGQIVDRYDTVIGVQKVGIERWLFNLAHELPFAYGLLSLVIAVLAGWGASAGFQALRR